MLEDEELSWYHIGLCQGMRTNWFYDDYEADQELAKVMDNICLSCPARTSCLREGIENKEYGLWGGVFLSNGKIDIARNEHKTDEIWARIRGTY